MKLQDKLRQLKSEKKAVLAANFYNFETLSGIVQAAALVKQPVILQLSESSINYLGIKLAASMAREILRQYAVEGWLHLDHGSNINLVKRCLDSGFDSVMIDASEQPLKDNIALSSEVVKLAASYKVNVEAEIGYIAKLGQEQNESGFTQPEDALYFVTNTGINALAVAIGSAHGFYKKPPDLKIELLARISESIPTPLVLHGSSGIPDLMLQNAIRNGICKVNLATETKNAFMLALQKRLSLNDEIDLRIVFPDATKAVIELISEKLKTIQNA